MSVIAPNAATYATRVPYITAAEYEAAPTGVNIDQLIPRGDSGDSTEALKATIMRASSWADTICHQTLAATIDTESGRHRVWRDGTVRIPLHRTPIVEVTGISMGRSPAAMAPLPDLSGVWIDRKVITVPVADTWPCGLSGSGQVFVSITYVNGWACTESTGPTSSGVQQINVSSPIGILPGMKLSVVGAGSTTVSTGEPTEVVQVSDGYQPGTLPVLLAGPLVYTHQQGAAVTSMPQAIRQAVICLTSALIQERGSDSFEMATINGEPTENTKSYSTGASAQVQTATDLLSPYARVI